MQHIRVRTNGRLRLRFAARTQQAPSVHKMPRARWLLQKACWPANIASRSAAACSRSICAPGCALAATPGRQAAVRSASEHNQRLAPLSALLAGEVLAVGCAGARLSSQGADGFDVWTACKASTAHWHCGGHTASSVLEPKAAACSSLSIVTTLPLQCCAAEAVDLYVRSVWHRVAPSRFAVKSGR